MTKLITFTDSTETGVPEMPKPASQFIPEWYKDMDSYVGGQKKPSGEGGTTATSKRCMPLFDSITSGYIITSFADVYVSQKFNKETEKIEPWYEWSTWHIIGFHPIEQAPNHPLGNGFPYPKWKNLWGIKTPPGYSCLFVQPFHRPSPFTILPGIVDTDEYSAPVHFPFVLNDSSWEGLIPAGTPIAQVIPFKRDSWKIKKGNKENEVEINETTLKLNTTFFDRYKNKFWNRKEYK
jgi:hypothetical protein